MNRIIAITISLAGLSGCIIYDNDGHERTRAETPSVDDTGVDSPIEDPALPSVTLSFLPPQSEQGESFIGRLTVEEGDLSLGDVSDVIVYGDAAVDAIISRSNEVLISVTTADDATPGVVDLLVELNDGTATWLDDAFTIFPQGSGNSANAWGSENPGGLDSAAGEEECP